MFFSLIMEKDIISNLQQITNINNKHLGSFPRGLDCTFIAGHGQRKKINSNLKTGTHANTAINLR